MTYMYELGQLMTRDPELRSGTLVFDGTRVPVEALLDDLQRGYTAEEFLSGHPTVFPEHVRACVMCLEDVLRDAEGPEAAGQRLLAHADWALISERVARRIDADLRAHRERVRPLDPDLLERAERLVVGVDVSGETPGKADDAVPPYP